MELMYNNKKKDLCLYHLFTTWVWFHSQSHNLNLYPKLFTKFIITYVTYSILNLNFSLVFSSTRWTLHQCPAICSHAPSKSKFTIFRLNQLPLITAFLRDFSIVFLTPSGFEMLSFLTCTSSLAPAFKQCQAPAICSLWWFFLSPALGRVLVQACVTWFLQEHNGLLSAPPVGWACRNKSWLVQDPSKITPPPTSTYSSPWTGGHIQFSVTYEAHRLAFFSMISKKGQRSY